ncbi:MAG: hypothetical protein JWO42_2806 [Chloroflexi bacterium]|nr:hypothetical protein [Chloroflexota bacterium]
MFPFIARLAMLAVAGRMIGRIARHPRVAPYARSRKGRLALLALGWGMRRRRRTRGAGRMLGRVSRHSRLR